MPFTRIITLHRLPTTSGAHSGLARAPTATDKGPLNLLSLTKRVARVEENIAAERLELSAVQIERLNNLTPAAGEHHNEGNTAIIDR